MEMLSIYDALGIERWDQSKISAPFHIWPLSESSVRTAASLGMIAHPEFSGFIDTSRETLQIGEKVYHAVTPSPEITDTVYVLSAVYKNEIYEAISRQTRARECYLLDGKNFFTHICNIREKTQTSRTALFDEPRLKLIDLLPKTGWPQGSKTFRTTLRIGLEDLTTEQIDDLFDFVSQNRFDVVYYAVPAYYSSVRQSLYLRRRGLRTLLITVSTEYSKGKEKYFDSAIQTDGNYFLAFAWALLVPCDVLHIGGWMNHYMTAAALTLLSPGKTVLEFMDIPEFLCNRETYAQLYDADIAHDDFEGFPILFKNAGGLLFNHHEECIGMLTEKYNPSANTVKYHNYVCDEFCVQEKVPLSKPYSIVYAGSLIPSSFPHEYFGDCQLLPLIKKLTRNGLRFTVYGNPLVSLRDHYWDYLFEARKNPLFSILEGAPPEVVAKKLARHHFGLLMYIYDGVNMSRYHLMNLPTKMTLYLEAGLPLLVSEELEYLADVVRANNIGLVASPSDIDVIHEKIECCDYGTMRENVLTFRRHFHSEPMSERLLDFYGRL